ncbi:MAG: hypothetical protein J7530_14685 [Novosphingobium sp.]|nr:hypothetical protein [Novosphingobium sp.]
MTVEKSKIVKLGIVFAGPVFIMVLEFYRYGLSWRILATLGVILAGYLLAAIILGRKANRI